MLFRTIDHYNTYNDELKCCISNTIEENECFICYEVALEDEKNTIELSKQPYYVKICECNGYIHKHCLNNWISLTEKCPICRIFIEKRIPFIKPKTVTVLHRILIKVFNKLTRFVALFVFFYFTIEFYLSILNSKVSYEHSCLIYENSRLFYIEESKKE